MRSFRWRTVFARAWLALVLLAVAGALLATDGPTTASDGIWAVIIATFTGVGTLLVVRQPDNAIGWLLMVPGVAVLDPMGQQLLAEGPPVVVTPAVFAAIWLTNYSWLFVFFPTILMLALFPTGRPLSPRWRWHPWLLGVMTVFLVFAGTFQDRIGPLEGDWTVDNPVGVLPLVDELWGFWLVWTVALATVTLGAVASMGVRFRRAAVVERQQLKWLLYAVSLFASVYVPLAFVGESTTSPLLVDVLFAVSLLFIPVAMAIAILRHHLFDIDVVVRRTVVYAIVTVALAAVYLGSVLTLGSLARGVVGADSSWTVVVSTLVVARLFTPVRRRVQRGVSARFFRGAYDAERVTSTFARMVRDETDLHEVSDDLRSAVAGTLQPATVNLWLPPPRPAPTSPGAATAPGP